MLLPNGILFEDSYVLSISAEPYKVVFAMDFVLTSEHPSYCPPRPGERACFRKGKIEIGKFRRLLWDASGYSPSTDAEGELDFGSLDEIVKIDDVWRLSGDWGSLEVSGGEMSVSIDLQNS